MEKLLILSDIHGNVRRAAAVLCAHPDCTGAVFLGDGARYVEYLQSLAPHTAFYTDASIRDMARCTVEACRAFERGEPYAFEVR